MSKHLTHLGAAALATLGTVAGALAFATGAEAATPPSSATPPTLAQIQAKAAAAVSARISKLDSAVSRVEANKALGSDASTVVAYLQSDIAPLQALGAKIAGDTSVSEAEADYHDIFVDFRVYALVLPAAAQAAEADAVTVTALPALTSFSGKAQSRLTSQNQAMLQPMIDSLNSDISGASAASSGVAGTVLAYTPAQWNADHSLLSATKSSLETAHSDVKSGRQEAQEIRQYLRSSRPAAGKGTGAGPTTTS